MAHDTTAIKRKAKRLAAADKRKRLTAKQVREARALHATGIVSINRLAKEFGVDHHTMWDVIRRKTWKATK